MRRAGFAIVGAAESTRIGKVPELSSMGLALDAAANALADAGLEAAQVDGLTSGYMPPANVAQLLGMKPAWVDNTVVGGCSWMNQLRDAMAAIAAGYCETVLITYGESGRSHGFLPNVLDLGAPGSIEQQFDLMYCSGNRASLFAMPVARYMHETGTTHEQLAAVPVIQREWAAMNSRAKLREPTTVQGVLDSRVIAWPILRDMCCLVSDAGGALIVTSAERSSDFPNPPVYVVGTGSSVETGLMSPAGVEDPLRPGLVRRSAEQAFASAGVAPDDIDHLMVYDAFAHTPIFGLEGLGFVKFGEAGPFIEEGNTAPGGRLPMNTNGGGLCYAHSGSYGMLCMQESVRQLRGEAEAQVDGVRTSLAHGWGGFWSACATVIFSNEIGDG